MTSETKLSAPSAIDITTLAWESPAPPDILPFDWHPYATEENWLAMKTLFPRDFREQDHQRREQLLHDFILPFLVLFPHRITELEPNQEDHANIAAELASHQFNPYRTNLALFLKTVWSDDITPVAEKTLRTLEERAAKGKWTMEEWTGGALDTGGITTLAMAANAKILDPGNFPRLSIPKTKWDQLEEATINLRKRGGFSFTRDRQTKFWLVFMLAQTKILSPDLYREIAPSAKEWAEIKRDIEHRVQSSSFTLPSTLSYISRAAICAAQEVKCTGRGLELVMPEPTFTKSTPKMPPVRRF